MGLTISFLSFQQMIKSQEDLQSKALGQQIKQIADASNLYITNHYDLISALQNSTGSTTDPGPRNCIAATFTCNITVQTLINEGFLPNSYSQKNAFGSGYNITLKRSGTAPYYNISGVAITNSSLITGTGNNIRYDMLGKAMQEAGIDSGMTRTSPTVLEGFKGGWNNTSTEYSIINKQGLLGYQLGYGSNSYSVFLRRDGTLPMTGNLNMNSNDINSAKNITASATVQGATLKSTGDTNVGGNFTVTGNSTMTGLLQVNNNINATGTVKAGSWVSAKNGYGDTISLGGDSSPGGIGPDYELLLGSNKPLTIHSPNSNRGNDIILDIDGNTRIQTKLATNSLNPNDIPSGWVGGLRTQDVYASGTIGAGTGGNVNSYMNSAGNIYASGNITSNSITSNYIKSNGDINAGGNIANSGVLYTNGTITSNGRFIANEFIQVYGTVNEGAICSSNGLIGRTSDGTQMYCINGYWSNIISSKIDNGGMLLPGGMKIMWGKVSGNVYKFQNNTYESDFIRINPTFSLNGTTYGFTKILNVQLTPFDKPNQNQEIMWTTDSYNNGFSFAFSALSSGYMSGNYLAIGY